MPIGVGIVQINVTDLAQAWRFYVEALDIPGKPTLGAGRAFELDLGDRGPRVLVHPVRRQGSRGYPDETGVVLVFRTDDMRRTVAEWRERGVPFLPISWSRDPTGIAESPFGPFVAFRDPFGNVHELLEER